MRYLGGKTKISKDLAAAINRFRRPGQAFWDPFCGSLAMSIALGGEGLASDINPVLISLYQAIVDGWEPPATLSRDEWQAAKLLPDSDPLKGFAGFACSFRGLYFHGYAGGYVGPKSRAGALAASEVLTRDVALLKARGVRFRCTDFLKAKPRRGLLLYLDPPYRGTVPYEGTPPFDHELFYRRALEWSAVSDVFVSEYAMPFGDEVWAKSRARMLRAGTKGGTLRATEKLFRITPDSVQVAAW